jgi:pilus assembly protein Flp/PilA
LQLYNVATVATFIDGLQLKRVQCKHPFRGGNTMNELWANIKGFMLDEEGATAVEYGVLIALIIAICVVVIGVLGRRIESAFNAVNIAITGELPAGS